MRREPLPRSVAAGNEPGRERRDLLDAVRLEPESVLERLRSSRQGLSQEEASSRLSRAGPNELPRPRIRSLPRQLLDQLTHFFAVMLWIAAGLAVVGGMPQLGVAIVIVILVNGVFSFAQEYRAERAVRALSALLPETVVVRRGGRKHTIAAVDLVPGDVVVLREGDRISADARVLRSSELKVDMSTLTGESKPVGRIAEPVTGDRVSSSRGRRHASATSLVWPARWSGGRPRCGSS
jgi:magnesium-transporting ATPase (P-type)